MCGSFSQLANNQCHKRYEALPVWHATEGQSCYDVSIPRVVSLKQGTQGPDTWIAAATQAS